MFRLLFVHEKRLIKFVNLNQSIQYLSNEISKSGGSDVQESVKQKTKTDREKERKKADYEQNKQTHKTFFKDEERKLNLIEYFDDFFDKNVLQKDAKTFIRAIEAFKENNKNKNLYIDFIYGAIQKMKEFNAHEDIEAYKKLVELFPIGPLRMQSLWQRDNMHFPRVIC